MAGKAIYRQAFLAQTAAKQVPGALVLFDGAEEDYQEATAALRAALVTPGFESFNFSVFAGKETPAEEIVTAARTRALGGGGRLVVLREPKSLLQADLDRIIEYLKDPDAGNCLAVVADGLEYRHRLVQAALSAGTLVSFGSSFGQRRGQTIREGLRALGLSADAQAFALLEEMLPEDRGLMNRELEKLATFLGKRTQARAADLEHLITDRSGAAIGVLGEALMRRQIPRALRETDRLLEEGHEPIGLLGFLVSTTRLLIMARAVRDGLRETGELPDLARLAKGGKTQKERCEALLRESEHWTPEDLRSMLRSLREVDRLIKSTTLPPALLLEAALAGKLPPLAARLA